MKGIRSFLRSATNPKIKSVDDSDEDEEIVYGYTPMPELKNDVVYVALEIDNEDRARKILQCAVVYCKNNNMKLIIIHVLQPAVAIPLQLGSKFEGIAGEDAIRKHHEHQRLKAIQTLDKYVGHCRARGLQAERIWIENRSFNRGLIDLIIQNGIKWLVMGAGSRGRSKLKSNLISGKARFALDHAPSFVHIWFMSNDRLVSARLSRLRNQG